MDFEMPFAKKPKTGQPIYNPTTYTSGGTVETSQVPPEGYKRDFDPKYASLRGVLDEAYLHASTGKGKVRHGKSGLPFEEQRMLSITRLLDSEAGLAYQACKKVSEGLDLPTLNARVAEMLGAINYIAGIVIFMREKQAELDSPKSGRDSYLDSEDAARGGL